MQQTRLMDQINPLPSAIVPSLIGKWRNRMIRGLQHSPRKSTILLSNEFPNIQQSWILHPTHRVNPLS